MIKLNDIYIYVYILIIKEYQ